MPTCSFVFDVIVTNIKLYTVDITDPKELKVELWFNNTSIPITASRINVSEFKPNTGTQVIVNPQDLRQNLDECGIPITVTYSGYVLGLGRLYFPQNITERITEDMSDLVHVETCTLTRDGDVVGTLEILCRLAIKCVEKSITEDSLCRRYIDKSINLRDILFIVGESQRYRDACEPSEDNESLKFGIKTFGSIEADAKPPVTFMHNPVGDAACCEIRKMAQDCEQIVDSITKRSGQPKFVKPPCRKPTELEGPCSGVGSYPQKNSQESVSHFSCFSQFPALEVKSKAPCDPILMNVKISETTKKQMKANRFCPVCLTNLTWLPKFAACPNCGVKPVPIIEKTQEKELTADQIVLGYLGASPDIIENYSMIPCKRPLMEKAKEKKIGCRCTCKFGKLCAFCRVRKMCGITEIYQVSEENNETSEDYCAANVKTTESRPFLARVFSELRDLNNLKDTIEPALLEEQCEPKSTQRRSRQKAGGCQIDNNKKSISIKERRYLTNKRIAERSSKAFKGVKNSAPVPHRHGWAWASTLEARKHGWRPGLIRHPIIKLIKYFLQFSPQNNSFNKCNKEQESQRERDRRLPILNLCKKDGAIFITLRALNNPNVEMKPIVFKLVKSDLAVALSQIKRKLKAKGFRKCICHNTVMMCVCRKSSEKKHLEYALQKECKRRGMKNCVDRLVLTDTSDSEMEFDFDVTAPAKVAKPPSPLKPYGVNINTQTVQDDVNVPPSYPITYSPNWRAYDCAVGDRYTGTAFGGPYETVFEDGVFGYRGGGPHGTSATPGGRTKSKSIWGSQPGGPMRAGGRTVPMGSPGGVSFPGAKRESKVGKNDPIPVRMTKRYYKAIEDAAKAAAAAKQMAADKKKKGPDMMQYMIKKGAVPAPWNPNDKA